MLFFFTACVEVEHLVDDSRDTVAVLLHHLTDFLHLLVAKSDFRIGQHLREALEGIEGCANLVEYILNEL